MKAVIMAGGEGSRLRPLTCDIPKPMARLCGRPVLEYILELLAGHGVEEAALTLRYLPERIVDHFAGGAFAGVKLRFVEEQEPLGTAGGVKNACSGDTDVLVISGDAMCDFDLRAFMAFHKESGADVTILGKRVDDPREYGLIDMAPDGRIAGFIEKPAFSQAISDMANTGIYLLSGRALARIPGDRPYDFAKDLFPAMLADGCKLACWEGEGYWCDIGDLDSYIRCQQDMLHGRVRCRMAGVRDEAGNLFAAGRPHASVRIQPPVYLGRHVRIEESALLEAGSVVDDGCYIGRGARVSGSVLLQDSYISRRAKLTGALVCAGATVKDGAMLFEGSTVGAGATIGENATVNAGIKIWNKKRVPAAAVADTHIKTAAQAREFFDDDGISGQVGVELTPELAARIGCAVGSLNPAVRVALGRSAHPASSVLRDALCAGIRSTGAGVVDFGENFQAQFEFSMNFTSLPIGVFVRGDGAACIKVMSAGGLPATRTVERGVEGALSRGEFVRAPFDAMGDMVELSGMGTMYLSQLMRCAPKGLGGCSVRVQCRNPVLKKTLREALYKSGCDVEGRLLLEVSAQGDKVRIYDRELGYIPHHQILTWCCTGRMEAGEDVAVPFEAPQMIDEIAEGLGRKALRYYTCPADESDAQARRLAAKQMWSRDGLMQVMLFLALARNAGSIEALLARSPKFERTVRTLETPESPAALLQGLEGGSTSQGAVGEGVLMKDGRGSVLLRPLKRGTGLRIYAESVNAEAAEALCDDIERLLRRRMQPKGGL